MGGVLSEHAAGSLGPSRHPKGPRVIRAPIIVSAKSENFTSDFPILKVGDIISWLLRSPAITRLRG